MAPMSQSSILMLVAMSFLALGSAGPALAVVTQTDWKAYGSTTLSPKDGQVTCFYESKGISKNTDGNIKVWTKCLSDKSMNFDNLTKDQREAMLEESTSRLVTKNIPPIVQRHNLDNEHLMGITTFEAIANSGYVPGVSKALQEINCKNKKVRNLNFSVYKNGQYGFIDKPQEWADTPPDSIGSELAAMVCF